MGYARIGIACLLAGLSGCATQKTTATFKDVKMPILLGPVDRIGGGESLQTIGEEHFSGSAHEFISTKTSESTYSRITTTKTGSTGRDYLSLKLALEYDSRPNWDIRLTHLRPRTYSGSFLFGANESVTVNVLGDVVAVKGGKR